jgi:hypothetical protein
MSDRLSFVLEGAGWARLVVAIGGNEHAIDSFSYLTDALDDMLRMGIAIATDKSWAAATFDHEPARTSLLAETAWVEADTWVSGARLSAIEHGSDMEELTWRATVDTPRLWIVNVAGRDELARLFLAMADSVLDGVGLDEYDEAWGGRLGFPVRARAALEATLASEPVRSAGYRT